MANKKKVIVVSSIVVAVAALATGLYFLLKPDVPSERRMARILADIYTADAILQEYQNKGGNDRTIENTYHTVLSHYGMTKAKYDSAVAWYSRDPKKFSSVYERVVAILSTREEVIKQVADRMDSISTAIEALNDSLTSEPMGPKFTLKIPIEEKCDSLKEFLRPSGKRFTNVGKEIELDSLVGGHIDLFYKYSITKPGKDEVVSKNSKPKNFAKNAKPGGKPGSAKPVTVKYPDAYARIHVTYADTVTTRDSLVISVSKRVVQREAKLTVDLRDSVPATKVEVVVFENVNLKDMELTLRDIRLTYKPYDIVDTTDYDSVIPSLFAY